MIASTIEQATKSNAKELIINTKCGPIKGRLHTALYGDEYYGFEGVPFAEAPLGELRFKAPVPVRPWSDILDCTKKHQKALQRSYTNELEGAEDCLYLNIYVKKVSAVPGKALPVMVYLFGGGFERGDATRDAHGPDYLMMKDVVLVTIAYRCGALGFLSLSDPNLNCPGNAGLKDQLLGLRWINENIADFQGDNKNITLFGGSAGAASTQYMMLSPLAKGLFQKAILMSGTVQCSWALSKAHNLPYRLAQANGYEGEQNDKSIYDFLRSLEGSQLVLPNVLTKEDYINDIIFAFGPVIEPYQSENSIITQDPNELLANAWSNSMPIMIGAASFEGLLIYGYAKHDPAFMGALREDSSYMLPQELRLTYGKEKQKCYGDKLKAAHFEGKEISSENILQYCDYISYKLFWHPIFQTIQARRKHATNALTYVYRFDFDSPTFNMRRIRFCGNEQRGAAHCDDLCYLFHGVSQWKLDLNSPEFKTIQRMTNIWASFAEHSNPYCEEIEATWEPVESASDGICCLNIGDDLKVIDLPELPKLLLWDSIYD